MKSKAFTHCLNITDITEDVDMCVQDIQVKFGHNLIQHIIADGLVARPVRSLTASYSDLKSEQVAAGECVVTLGKS